MLQVRKSVAQMRDSRPFPFGVMYERIECRNRRCKAVVALRLKQRIRPFQLPSELVCTLILTSPQLEQQRPRSLLPHSLEGHPVGE
jgi:hypothetical protein